MSKVGLVLILAAALAGCSKSKCEKYADMEVKCGDIPEKEKDMTKVLARGMCEAADSGDKEAKALGDMIKLEAECTKYEDCTEYKKCTEAVKK